MKEAKKHVDALLSVLSLNNTHFKVDKKTKYNDHSPCPESSGSAMKKNKIQLLQENFRQTKDGKIHTIHNAHTT